MYLSDMKVVILARVSTDKQLYERQVVEMEQYCKSVGWDVAKIFTNKVSGAKKNEDRPEIMEMLAYIEENKIDKVCVLEISRLGRNTLEALKVIELLNEKKDMPIYQELQLGDTGCKRQCQSHNEFDMHNLVGDIKYGATHHHRENGKWQGPIHR